MYGNYSKTHKIKVFEYLFLCVFVILKILSKFSTFAKSSLYSMKIKEQTRKLAAGCSKHNFEVADKVDVVWRDFRRVLECFPNQNLCLNGNLCQVAPVNLALVDMKE